jgi:hypothetical protein
MEEIDIWRTANLLIQQHGARAIGEAARRAVDMLQNENEDGAAAWLQIIRAVNQLLCCNPSDGAQPN